MAEARDDDEVFVYMGGGQFVPIDVVRVRIDKSVKIIPSRAFYYRTNLIYVEFHDGIESIEKKAFYGCTLLSRVNFLGVKVVEEWAFMFCVQLTDLHFSEDLETIAEYAFYGCNRLRRIAMPLKDDLIEDDAFYNYSTNLTVDLVGGIHNTVASLHLEEWRNEMRDEINRINQVLPDTVAEEKTAVTQEWIRAVIRRLNHFKVEHKAMLKEATTLLELALWKADLNVKEGGIEREGVRTTRGRRKRARKEICITSGASIVIKNVLPFLQIR